MKKLVLSFFLLLSYMSYGQQFITAGTIEFEVKINNHKVYSGEGALWESIKDKLPQFSATYYKYTFKDDKSVYKFDRFDEKTRVRLWMNEGVDVNLWYSDYKAKSFVNQKFVFDDTYLLNGALMKIDWKLSPNETREIAGFNCRKATGVIFDSVYVFAYYTDEITISGGPMGIHGLPGMILGITIPRMFSSYIATRVELTADPKSITPPVKGKKKDPEELRKNVLKISSDWGTWAQQSIWNIFI
jgi:GLPGLI family protein